MEHHNGLALIMSALILLLPATQAAVDLVNYLVTTVLNPHPLPKLDYSKGVEAESATIVAIPTLLINEKQIRQLLEDIEVRYLVNRDEHIYYALLSDLPDTAEPSGETDRQVDLAIQLINDLNQKYTLPCPMAAFTFFTGTVFSIRAYAKRLDGVGAQAGKTIRSESVFARHV